MAKPATLFDDDRLGANTSICGNGSTQPHVLHVAYGGIGGIKHVVGLLVEELAELGVMSSVILYQRGALAEGGVGDYRRAADVKVVSKRAGADLRGIGRLIREAVRSDATIVVFHDPPRALAFVGHQWLVRHTSPKQVIFVSHAPPNQLSKVHQLIVWLAAAMCRATVRVGPNSFPRDGSREAVLMRRSLYTIPTGVQVPLHTSHVSSRTAAMAAAKAAGATLIGMGGRMAPVKDFPTLIHAVAALRDDAQHKDVRLCLAGDGPDRTRVESLARDLLGDRVILLGSLSRRDMASFYSLLDIYVQSSPGESDMSTSILNAMAAECCVVASRVPGISDTLGRFDRECLRLFSRGSVLDLQSILVKMVCSEEVRRSIGRAGAALVSREYSASEMARGYLAVFAQVDPEGPWHDLAA